jgi:arylsulfatase A-like enzyme
MICRLIPLLLAFAGTVPAAAAETQPARKPNVLVIVGDDMGNADTGFQGCKDIPTPHLDALAKGGIRLTNGYVSGPYCSPTRAGLLTGRYQQRFGHEFNPGGGKAGLPTTEITFADRFKAAGYATGLVGKWHLGSAPEFHPQKRGFNEFYGFLGGAHSYFPARDMLKSVLRGNEPVNEQSYLTDAFGREAVAYIDRHKAEPFFLYLAFNAVHTPMHADDARLKKFAGINDTQRRTYAAMMMAMDDAVGAVMTRLREDGLEEHTLIAFFSDNGGPTMQGTTINGSRNTPLRGSKRQTLEGGIRVPFVMTWKGHLPVGLVYDQPVIQLDLQPTALAACGIAVGPNSKLEGVNLLPYLTGKAPGAPHEALFWRFGQQMAVRKGDWKLVRYGPNANLQTGETWPKLYNLKDDIGEATDLAAKMPDKVKELQSAWDEWNAKNVPPLWGAEGKKKGK